MCCGIIVSVRASRVENIKEYVELYPPSKQRNRNFTTNLGDFLIALFNKKFLLLFKNTCVTCRKKNPHFTFYLERLIYRISFLLNFGVCCSTQTHSLKKIHKNYFAQSPTLNQRGKPMGREQQYILPLHSDHCV